MRQRSLILIGHGSHLNADSSAPVYDHAARVRSLGLFDEVLEAFWKEEPSLRDALDMARGDDIYIVPLFLAEGYFTRQVLPRELGISGPSTRFGSRIVRYCPPVGAHPAMADMILQRAFGVSALDEARRRAAALVIIGHGTERSSTSGNTLYDLVSFLRARSDFGRVECGFLDERPEIGEVLEDIDAPDILLVPFFIAEGWHTAETIPADLGLTGEVTTRGGQIFWYSPPVGTLPEMADVIVEVARDAGAFESSSEPAGPPPLISRARDAFFRWLDVPTERDPTFLAILIRRLPGDAYELRNVVDEDVPLDRLQLYSAPQDLFSIARRNAAGAYRPLKTVDDLVPGWAITGLSRDQVWDAIALAYPATALHWYRALTSDLRTISFAEFADRQTGLYEMLRRVSSEVVRDTIQACCSRCLRLRVWDRPGFAGPEVTAASRGAVVPCTEPCTLFATTVRESASQASGAGSTS